MVSPYHSRIDFSNWNPLSLIKLNCDNVCCDDLQSCAKFRILITLLAFQQRLQMKLFFTAEKEEK